MPAPGDKIGHAEIQIGDSHVMLADEFPEMGFLSPLTVGAHR
jgi:PhnB protein